MNTQKKSQDRCGCCEGVEQLTPQPVSNRPGLDRLDYRVGTHGRFLETMQAQLSKSAYPALADLHTRESHDPAIALLDAWATVADVLTFYQERIANEGYLRTAVERRSLLELGRLVGYKLRPGVAASVYLAFELEKEREVVIPTGTRAQSVPGPGEEAQYFETAEDLPARGAWNALKPRQTRPQRSDIITASRTVYLDGVTTGLKPNDPILIVTSKAELYRVCAVDLQKAQNRTKVTFWPWAEACQKEITVTTTRDAKKPSAKPPYANIPTPLEKKALVALRNSLKDFVNITPDQIQRVSIALLSLFSLIAAMPTTSSKRKATAEAISALQAIRRELDLANLDIHPHSELYTWLQEIRIWIDKTLVLCRNQDSFLVKEPTDLAVGALKRPRPLETIPPLTSRYLSKEPQKLFAPGSDAILKAFTDMYPNLFESLEEALETISFPVDPIIKVYAFRVRAAPFGHNAMPRPDHYDDIRKQPVYEEWVIDDPLNHFSTSSASPSKDSKDNSLTGQNQDDDFAHHDESTIYLDREYEIQPNSWLVIDSPNKDLLFTQPGPTDVQRQSLSAYGMGSKATRINLGDKKWLNLGDAGDSFDIVRQTAVYAQSELLALAEAPIEDKIGYRNRTKNNPDLPVEIELDGVYVDLEPGRWLILSGAYKLEADPPEGEGETTGILLHDTELIMIASVKHGLEDDLPGDTYHTTITLANELSHAYERDTIKIHGNVVKATHGETREEVLGSGDASQVFQSFPLAQKPLTYLAAPTAAGAESTLQLYINDIQWHEAPDLTLLGPKDRSFVNETDAEDVTKVILGDGRYGARPPTGTENIRAVYRKGIGQTGNVKAQQISQLVTRPLGVKNVINPKPATGGAHRESVDQARRNIPIGVMALERLVSVPDYAFFARAFAGIGKASAVMLSDCNRRFVQITIAGADDIPIDSASDLYRNLVAALRRCGDPYLPFEVVLRELMLIVIDAKVRVRPDYLWEIVEPHIRATLLDTFSFARRELGQDVLLSEVIKVIQSVEGVDYVDVDVLDSVVGNMSATEMEQLGEHFLRKSRIVVKMGRVQTHHLVERGNEDCSTIAIRYTVDEQQLKDLNPSLENDLKTKLKPFWIEIPERLQPGQLAYLSDDTLFLTEITS